MTPGGAARYWFVRARASASSSARYASSASRLTRQTPLRPIFNAGSSPLRMSVYTCDTVTLSTSATSAGRRRGGGSSSTLDLLRSSNAASLTAGAFHSVANRVVVTARGSSWPV